MRPVGSTNGRVPEGGYPDVSAEMGAFLSGFIEGEGCFGIVKQTRGYGFRPHLSLVARADDADLVRALHRATNVGRITHKPAYRTSKPQVSWTVTAKSDCQRLVELLDAHPFRGRKATAYEPWRTSVIRWVGDDATKRLTPADWAEFPEWKAEIQRANQYEPSTFSSTASSRRRWEHWQAYLAGFITAEAHFAVERKGSPRFVLRLRADDHALLEDLRFKTGVGRVYGPYERSGLAQHPVVQWQVFSAADTMALVDLLECWSPGGRKGLEFHVWKHAVFERAVVRGWNRERVALVRERLMALRRFER